MNDKDNNLKGSRIEVRNNDIYGAMRKLKKLLASDGIIKQLREKEFYMSKSQKRRINKNAAIRRYKKSKLEKDLDS
jgi:ribosomal protein S21